MCEEFTQQNKGLQNGNSNVSGMGTAQTNMQHGKIELLEHNFVGKNNNSWINDAVVTRKL